MNVYKARVKEPNPIGSNVTIETGKYADPVAHFVNSKSTYKIGQEVLCVDVDGSPVILGEVPPIHNRKSADGIEKVSGLEVNTNSTPNSRFVLDSRFSRVGEYSNSPLDIPELLPGDTSIKSSTGNSIKALAGGINVLDSGTANISTNKLTSSVDINCSEFYLNTAMGELSISPQSNGDFSFNFKGNPKISETTANTNPNAEPLYNVSLILGREIELTSSNGFGIKVNPSGKITLKGTSLFLQQEDGEVPLHQWPQNNAEEQEVKSKKVKVEAQNEMEISSGGGLREELSKDKVSSIGGISRTSVGGPDPLRDPLILANPAGVYSSDTSILNGGRRVTIGSTSTGGGKYKCTAHGDIHLNAEASNRGGGSLLIDPSAVPNVATNGLWNSVNTSKYSLHTSSLASTPALPVDGLTNPWSAMPPLPGGVNPLLTGYVKYSQFQTVLLPFFNSLSATLTILAADPILSPASRTGATAGVAAITSILPLLPLMETKTSFINELPV